MKSHPFKHLHTINSHKRAVLSNARHMGIYFHALKHDLTKYGYKEFSISSKYWTGTSSPVLEERKANSNFSLICQHHTKRNPHHWEYWTDFYKGDILAKTMPYIYAVEYVCDMIAASKVYNGKSFKRETPLKYFKERVGHYYMTTATATFIEWCLTQFADSEWKHLNKKETKVKYDSVVSSLPDVETFKEIRK